MRVLLVLLVVSVAGVAAAAEPPTGAPPDVERLPPVDTGPESLQGDYLDLAPAEPPPAPSKIVRLRVTSKGVEPRMFELDVGKLAKIVVTREVEETCATSLSSKELEIMVEAPLGKEAEVLVTPKEEGSFVLACPGGKVGVGVRVK